MLRGSTRRWRQGMRAHLLRPELPGRSAGEAHGGDNLQLARAGPGAAGYRHHTYRGTAVPSPRGRPAQGRPRARRPCLWRRQRRRRRRFPCAAAAPGRPRRPACCSHQGCSKLRREPCGESPRQPGERPIKCHSLLSLHCKFLHTGVLRASFLCLVSCLYTLSPGVSKPSSHI